MMAGFEVGNAGQGLQGLADSGTLADMNPRFSGGAPWRARGWSQQPAGFCTGLAATTLFRARVIYLHLKVRSDRYATGNHRPLSRCQSRELCTHKQSLLHVVEIFQMLPYPAPAPYQRCTPSTNVNTVMPIKMTISIFNTAPVHQARFAPRSDILTSQ